MQIRVKTYTDSMRVFNSDSKKIEDWSRSIAFFLYCKTFHVNGVYYKGTPRNIARQIGLSHNTVRKNIERLKKLDLVRECNGHIVFKRATKRKSNTLYTVPVKKGMSMDNIMTLLRNEVVKDNARRQMFVFNNKSYVNSINSKSDDPKAKLNLKQVKKAKRIEKTLKSVNGQGEEYWKDIPCGDILLSDRRVGQLIGRGRQTAHAHKKKAQEMGLIHYTQHVRVRPIYVSEKECIGWFYHKGQAKRTVTLYASSIFKLVRNPHFVPKGFSLNKDGEAPSCVDTKKCRIF